MRRIEICGGIASGKTTLAKLLSSRSGGSLALEQFRENPFWRRFYSNQRLWFEEKNLCFLVQHTGSIKEASAGDLVVCDYAVFQDLAYARLSGDSSHMAIMETLFAHLSNRVSPPALVVHLVCSPRTLLNRIRARGRLEEASISIDYLAQLNEAIDSLVKEYARLAVVQTIDSERVDFSKDPATISRVGAELLARV